MCGISAIFGLKDQKQLYHQIVTMTNMISHRGPDDEGYVLFSGEKNYLFGGKSTSEEVFKSSYSYTPRSDFSEFSNVSTTGAMGHRRLAILDLSPAGHQPMCSDDQKVWVTYNGEIYNYIELRERLIKEGCVFSTNTDTEVLIKAYQRWGIECLREFNGMFSFVLYDRQKQVVFAVRDPFGIKPLYYWVSPEGWIAFASEIKQFTPLKGWIPKMNPQMVYEFLNWGALDHTKETMFKDVKQVGSGSYLRLDIPFTGNSLKEIEWYRIPKPSHLCSNLEESSKGFYSHLESSVELRLRSDVPVGSCLSGGLDSTSIVCIMNRLLKNSNSSKIQHTFSACSHIPEYCEKKYIDCLVSKLDLKANFLYPNHVELFEELSTLIWHQDEPIPSTSMYAQWKVFQLAKKNGIKVMLDGQGSDEQLAGYHGFFGHFFFELLKKGHIITLFKEVLSAQRIHPNNKFLLQLTNKMFPKYFRNFFRKILNRTFLQPSWLNQSALSFEPRFPFEDGVRQSVNDQCIFQMQQSSLPSLLHFEDRNSMAHSIEARIPFLDFCLVDYTLSLAPHLKIQKGITKVVLREAMKTLLPEKIRTRTDKMGFVTPEEYWLKHNPSRFLKMIQESIEASDQILNPNILHVVKRMIDGKIPFSFLPWRIISFGQWIKVFSCTKA